MKCIQYIERASGQIQEEIVPGERWLQWLYYNPLGKVTLQFLVKQKFLSKWYGLMMDRPGSRDKISPFIKELKIDMSEASLTVDDYKSFNDFFIRSLHPQARPVDRKDNIIVSPADGKVLAFENIQQTDSFFAKGQKFNLLKFLKNSELNKKYQEGSLLVIRLAPVDYHRFHFPADGLISKSTPIQGKYYSVSPYAVKKRLKIFWENRREFSELKTETAGDILLCEVGATMVGSIIQSYSPETRVVKGAEKGWFKFGGSTVVLIFEKQRALVDRDIVENTQRGFETSIKMGERLAVCNDK